MNKLEYRVDSKIIKQLSLFLMLHGIKDFQLEFHSNNKNVQFIIKAKSIKQEIVDFMVEKIGRKRELEIEIYGWELMGDTDSKNELDILGSLIDKIEVKKLDDYIELTLTRVYRYNE
jgi:hypothetical protein